MLLLPVYILCGIAHKCRCLLFPICLLSFPYWIIICLGILVWRLIKKIYRYIKRNDNIELPLEEIIIPQLSLSESIHSIDKDPPPAYSQCNIFKSNSLDSIPPEYCFQHQIIINTKI